MLTVGSLFSGIGGLDLGLERSGMNVIWQSEIDPYASRVLKKHWPEVPNHGDIKTIRWGDIVRPDVLCGGYPCQPFSHAGKRKGEEDPRHLWPWVRQAISELRPRYAILENVRGHLSLGGTTVIGEITALGYDCEWRVVSAASVGANHRRDRIIIVAYPNSRRQQECEPETEPLAGIGERNTNVANSNSGRVEGSRAKQQTTRVSGNGEETPVANDERKRNGQHRIAGHAGQAHRGGVYHGIRQTGYVGGEWWQTEPDVGRVANGVPDRAHRLKALGNAVVPQLPELIGRAILAAINESKTNG
jgi:DNA (cytosine-5)-methyltransferase 1